MTTNLTLSVDSKVVFRAKRYAARCDLLVTRDPGGFKGSRVRVLDPRSAAALLRAE